MPYKCPIQERLYQRNYQRGYSGFKNEKQTIVDNFIAEFPDIKNLLPTLDSREKTVVKYYYGVGLQAGENYSLTVVGKRLGYTRQHIQRIKEDMLKKLRAIKEQTKAA